MDPHPLAVPAQDERALPPYLLDLDELAIERADAIATVRELLGPPIPVSRVADVEVAGVACRVYSPRPDVRLPIVVYVHGGGWIGGAIETVDGVCRRLAVHGDVAVVSVGYRLSPEVRWPVAVDEVDRVVASVQAGEVDGCDGSAVAVAGDSAGGHLATVVARRARDAGRPVAHQALVYPVTDAVGIIEGDPATGAGMGFARGEMAMYWDAFLPPDADRHHPDVSPLRADLAGMPPTFLLLAGHDILTPEAEAYGEALVAAGVEVVATSYPRMPHGFLRRLAIYPDAAVACDQLAMVLRAALHG